MNAYDKLFHIVNGDECSFDSHLVMPYNSNFCVNVAGYDLYDCYTNGRMLADAHTKAYELTGQDVVIAQSDQYYLSEGLGLKTKKERGSLPTVLELPVKQLSDIEKLRVPDPAASGRMPVYLEAIRILRERFGNQVPIRAPGTGPYSMAGHLMEPTNFITAIVMAEMDEDESAISLLQQLMETTYETHYRFIVACLEAGATIVQCADSLASLDITSPSIYEKYAFPYEKRFFEKMKKLKSRYNFVTLLHICGNNTPIAPLLAKTGCDILECDYKVDLHQYAELMGKDVCLLGNLNPAGNLLSGSPERVAEEVRDACKQAEGARYIVGSGCEVGVKAPLENIRAMVKTGHGIPYSYRP